MSKVWLVTGSASGLGRVIAEAALARGDRMVATARDPHRLADLAERFGDQVRTCALDVTDAAAAKAAVGLAVASFGRLDVLVNNAGYGHVTPFEQTTEDDFRGQLETNFYGVVNVTRAALPFMRRQRAGHIIQVSSVGGRVATPGLSAYQSAKWAVGGFSEVLAQEVASLGIKVCAIEPGGMRTNWVARAGQDIPPLHPDFEASVGAVLRMLAPYAGQETGDPARVAEVVLRLADHDNPPVHLLLGSDAVRYAAEADSTRAATGERWRDVSGSTDYALSTPVPVFPTP